MSDTIFERPVSIFIGLGYPNMIDNVHDAFRVLCEWSGRRGPVHSAALNACKAALSGGVGAETARGMFEAFARAHGIWAPDVFGPGEMASAQTTV